MLGICITAFTTYHPQMDGQTERVNQELELYLRLFVNERQDNWDDLQPMAKFQYNNHVHASTCESPFMLDTGCHPRMGFKPHQPPSHLESINEFKERMESSLSNAKAALVKAKHDMATYYNCQWKPSPMFAPGDKVFLDASDIHTTCPSKKLVHRQLAPYLVKEQVRSQAYYLCLPKSLSHLHPVFPIIKLTPALNDLIPG